MISSAQKQRLDRVDFVKKIIKSYGKDGVNYNELKSRLMITYGYADRTVSGYIKMIIESGFVKEMGNILVYDKKSELRQQLESPP